MSHTSNPYDARNVAAIILAHLALAQKGMSGWNAYRGRDESANHCKDVLYIETPFGQMSYHIAPDDADALAGIPINDRATWDGKFNGQDLDFARLHRGIEL